MARGRESHLRRYRQIAEVLARHGLGFLLAMLGLERVLSVPAGLLGRSAKVAQYTRPEHLRMALEELGTTFIKLGQIASTRPDLLPPDYQEELAKLQDAAPPVPFPIIHQLIAVELGRPVEECFATFEETPLASASIGQAHAATLFDGTEVVVKVRRPGVVAQVEEDLAILTNLAAVASRRWELADQYDVRGLMQEFARTLESELDYITEGRNAERFGENFVHDPMVHIPRVFWETTSGGVLTLERLHGIKISDLGQLTAAGIDRVRLAERAARLELTMVFEDGYFHADPHPGNFLIEPAGSIGLIDFGMVGTLDERTQDQLAWLLMAVASQDAERIIDTLLELGVARRRVNRLLLRQDIEHLMEMYYRRPLGEIQLAPLLNDALEVIRRHRLQLPPNLALLVKVALMSEGLGRQLDPHFELTTVLVPYGRRLMQQQFSPERILRRLQQAGIDAARLGLELPQQVRRIVGELERGGIEVGMRPEGFDPVISRVERLINRIVLGIITAAFVIGLSMLLTVYPLPGWERFAGVVFALGFVVVGVLGIYLAWIIIRSHGG